MLPHILSIEDRAISINVNIDLQGQEGLIAQLGMIDGYYEVYGDFIDGINFGLNHFLLSKKQFDKIFEDVHAVGEFCENIGYNSRCILPLNFMESDEDVLKLVSGLYERSIDRVIIAAGKGATADAETDAIIITGRTAKHLSKPLGLFLQHLTKNKLIMTDHEHFDPIVSGPSAIATIFNDDK